MMSVTSRKTCEQSQLFGAEVVIKLAKNRNHHEGAKRSGSPRRKKKEDMRPLRIAHGKLAGCTRELEVEPKQAPLCVENALHVVAIVIRESRRQGGREV